MRFWGFPRHVSTAEKQAKAARKLEQLKKKQDVRPVILQGHAIARTWWGKSWNQNLERYADYSNRIGRGRSYVRHGAVLDLQISNGEIKALVQGSRSKPYEILIKIGKLSQNSWERISSSCSGMLDSVSELLAGDFPKELGELFLERDAGLFPAPKEIAFECSCPDWASMCKHVAATLYGVGARLDEDATLFFTLRGVETADLVRRTVSGKAESLLEKASKKSTRIIDDADLSALFGIELIQSEHTGARKTDKQPGKKAIRIKNTKSRGKAKKKSDVIRKLKSSGAKAKSIQPKEIAKKKHPLQNEKTGKRVR
ncbi:MAG TPA: hypothetical protein VL087_06690 [Nitrospirota bacterium]|nr:hypothetical protein [Nitrospirota bacterium]